jgi:hypothetical protein
MPQQILDQLKGRFIRPMHVVEYHDQSIGTGKFLQQHPHSTMQPVPSGLVARALRSPRHQRWEDRGEQRERVRPHLLDPKRLDPHQVVIKHVDERPERDTTLELGRLTAED